MLDEPPEMLDAIAADPENEAAWHVLADWLLEQGAPHGAMAAYDLKIGWGTRNAELLGDYVEGRRARHRLPSPSGVFLDPVEWRCGYAVQATLSAWRAGYTEVSGPGAPVQAQLYRQAVEELLALPQLRALHRLTVVARPPPPEATLKVVLGAAPAVLRRLSVRTETPPDDEGALVEVLRLRPPRAVRLDLELGRLESVALLGELARAGWRTIDLRGTHLGGAALDVVVAQHPGTTFLLGGTGLEKAAAAKLDLPNVVFVPKEAQAALVSTEGAIYPLVGRDGDGCDVEGLRLTRSLMGWHPNATPERTLTDGAELAPPGHRGRRTLTFREGPELDAWYRERLHG